ncbi:MAG: hypothetical protein ABJP79_00700 [Tateyamaria sp.]|uniref:hypothetical protein n=1 Tax=Tateyamaria sp. TaxID=1929288 RepID=UPI00329D12B3
MAEQCFAPELARLLEDVTNEDARDHIKNAWDEIANLVDRPALEDVTSVIYEIVGADTVHNGLVDIQTPWFTTYKLLDMLGEKCGDHDLVAAEFELSATHSNKIEVAAKEKRDALKVVEGGKAKAGTPKPKSTDMRDRVFDKIDAKAAKFTPRTKEQDIDEAVKTLIEYVLDANSEEYLIDQVVAHTSLKRVKARKKVQALIDENKKANAPAEKPTKVTAKSIPVVNRWGEEEMVEYVYKKMEGTDENGDPLLYEYHDNVCTEKQGKRYMPSKPQFKALVSKHTSWQTAHGSGDSETFRSALPPMQITENVYDVDPKPFPTLNNIMTTPFYTANAVLVKDEGYHAESKTLLRLDELNLPDVPDVPTDEDVTAALLLIFEEVFGDFPIGKMDRESLIKSVVHGQGEANPSAAHLLAMLLQHFVRDMITGVTPMYAITKPKPGTGGGLLVEATSLITDGASAPVLTMPDSDEEFTKTITSLVEEGSSWCFFDNMNASLMSGNLASAITAPVFKARLLGKNTTSEAAIRWIWVAVANNLSASQENLRRMVMLELDADMIAPDTRSDWRHADLQGYIKEHRGALVHACLVLVNNWIAKGMNEFSGKPLNSFESWSHVLGGVLEACNVRGFLENRDKLKSYGEVAADSDTQTLWNALSEYPDGQIFRGGGTSAVRGHSGTVESIKAVLEDCGEDGGAHPIPDWGFSKDEDGKIRYGTSKKIIANFRKEVRAPQEGCGYILRFDEHPDTKNTGQYYWIMRKEKIAPADPE